MRRLAKKLLLGAAFLFALPVFADRYPEHAEADRRAVYVKVEWQPDWDTVNKLCAKLINVPLPDDGVFLACYNSETHTIYAVQPRNFNDERRLAILGHEFWHALGARHPAP